MGAEHAVFYNSDKRILKVTIPEHGFGLIPRLNTHLRQVHDSVEPEIIKQIEFYPASVTEYLKRWLLCNELFQDDVELLGVVQWEDSTISLKIDQPYYSGDVVTVEEIQSEFITKGWERSYKDGRAVFINYAYNVIALDLEPRNCFLGKTGLQPFDVIVAEPNEELEEYLGIY